MARNSNYNYDPKTKKWSKSVNKSSNSNSTSGKTSTKKTNSGSSNSTVAKNSNNKSAKGKAQKKANYKDYYTLTGSLSVIANKETLKVNASDTVKLNGFGKFLTGNYYVEERTVHIGNGGLSIEYRLLKNNFRKTIKTFKKKTKKKGSNKRKKK